jgi:predicted secreted protein
MILQGKNLIVKADGDVIAAAKSCTLNIDCEIIKVSSPTDGQWEHIIAGMKSWSVSTTHLLKMERAIDLPLHDYLDRIGQSFTLQLELKDIDITIGGLPVTESLTGSAICRSSQITATKSNLMQGSFKFQGNGPLT